MEEQNLQRTSVEKANGLTHLLGAILAIPAGWYVITHGFQKSIDVGVSMVIFSIGFFVLYLASFLYHWVVNPQTKLLLRHFDHANIYVLIAASYTPVWLAVVGGTLGKVLFIVIWAVAIAGIIYKIIALGKYPKLSLAIYLIMGWSVVFAAKPVYKNLSAIQISFILAEGIFYSVGTYFYSKKDRPWFHVIWHFFVLAGTACHYVAMVPIVQ
ncbi:MAG: hemolysin III family protein [Bacteroidales bacterium]|nr:hemolysin III family protein [Bacteroidales bacterium]